MADTIRTRGQLEVLFHDNDQGDISAQDGRDLVTSAFGFLSMTDPTADWDRSDSAGVGAFFDAGSFVLNIFTQVEWRCYSGDPHMAIWQPAYNGFPRTIVAAGTNVTVDFDGDRTFTVNATGGGGVTAPLTLQPPLDSDFGLALKQSSPTQFGNLLQFEDATGTVGAATINAAGEFTNANPIGATGTQNERFGDSALKSLTAGNGNTALGSFAASGVTVGSNNTAVGTDSLAANFSGSNNTAIGQNSLGFGGLGDSNTCVGQEAGFAINGGSGNVCLGKSAGESIGPWNGNVAIGYTAIFNAPTGPNNVAVGTNAGNTYPGSQCTFLGAFTDGGGAARDTSTAIGYGATLTDDHQIMIGTAAESAYFPGVATFAFQPNGLIPSAQWRIVNGTTLHGTYSIGIFPLTVGDRLLTWDGVDHSTWGIWVVQVGDWTRAADMPAGRTYNGPAYVWIASDEEYFPAYPSLMTLEPLFWGPGTNPTTWTLGVDGVICCFASPTAVVTAGPFIQVTPVSFQAEPVSYNVAYVGPTSLNDWALFGGDLDPTFIDWTTWPPAATVPATNVGPGYPYSDLSGAPSAAWSRYEIDYTDFNAPPQTIVLETVPAGRAIGRVFYLITSLWTGATGASLTIGYANAAGSPSSNTSNFGGGALQPGGTPTPVTTRLENTYSSSYGDFNYPSTWQLTATFTGGISPVSGHSSVIVEWIDLPP